MSPRIGVLLYVVFVVALAGCGSETNVSGEGSNGDGAPAAEQTWEGTMTSQGTCCPGVPENPGSEVWEASLDLVVASDGSVTGTGDARATEPATFAIQPEIPPCTEIPVRIEGSFSESRGFAIRLFPPDAIESCVQAGFFANWIRGDGIDPPTQRIPLTSPGVADGQVTVSETGGLSPGTSENTFHLECTNC